MSGYLWAALPPNVRGSIEIQPDRDAATKECGRDNRGGKWWLCQYHSGFLDAETALIDRLETGKVIRQRAGSVCRGVSCRSHPAHGSDPTRMSAVDGAVKPRQRTTK